jgi:hypothetical protein
MIMIQITLYTPTENSVVLFTLCASIHAARIPNGEADNLPGFTDWSLLPRTSRQLTVLLCLLSPGIFLPGIVLLRGA